VNDATTTPKHWYVILSGWVDVYIDNFATMQDPSLERLEGEEGQLLKLTSSTFAGLSDYEEVLDDAQKWVHLIAGAMHIKQDPGPMRIINVVGVFDDGTTKKYPPNHRPVKLIFGIPTMRRNPAAARWNKGAAPRRTFEESVVLFTHRSGNPLVRDVLRFLSPSPDWFGLYKALEVIRRDLKAESKRDSKSIGKNGSKSVTKKVGKKLIVDNGWATEADLRKFDLTAEYHHRHWKSEAEKRAHPVQMNLIDARRLVGDIVMKWIIDVSERKVD
jgi:hypothetical protein